ncbi:Signal peptidase complex subunit 3 [Blastocladiella emersonii ATCC 22665]|nr:Signal peptidase complex subunit 3 [Blastocladiella emersonii ATCC 22665]
MHSVWMRVNAVFAVATTGLFLLSALIAGASLSGYLTPTSLPVAPALSVSRTAVLRPETYLHQRWQSYYHSPRHYGHVHFNLTADLAPLFGWNVKQVHAMVTLEYASPASASSGGRTFTGNKMTIWDAIVTTPEDARLVLANKENTFAVTDIRHRSDRRLDAADATLRLEWCVHTLVGAIRCAAAPDAAEAKFVFPRLGEPAVSF